MCKYKCKDFFCNTCSGLHRRIPLCVTMHGGVGGIFSPGGAFKVLASHSTIMVASIIGCLCHMFFTIL